MPPILQVNFIMSKANIWHFIDSLVHYCKSGNFHEHFIFISVKRPIWELKISQVGHDLPHSDLTISQRFCFQETLAHAKFPEDKTLAKISQFTVCSVSLYNALFMLPAPPTFILEVNLIMGTANIWHFVDSLVHNCSVSLYTALFMPPPPPPLTSILEVDFLWAQLTFDI